MNQEPSVLYVEDDEASIKILRFLLTREMGLSNVEIWNNSSDFLNKTQQLSPIPDIIFLDIHVDPISGFEMMKILRGLPDYQNTIIVAMTASVMNEEIQMLKEQGFDGAIGKPINHETFADTFQKILSGETIWQIKH